MEPVNRTPGERLWSWLQLGLGMAQMATATIAIVLLIRTGVSPGALLAAVVACLLTTVSVMLFGRKGRDQRGQIGFRNIIPVRFAQHQLVERSRENMAPIHFRSLPRRLVAEGVGTGLLLAAVVGSGIMGERLSAGNTAVALLANTLATGAALVALILTFGPISGAHFNPAVSFADASQGGISWSDACAYTLAQIAGALVGVAAADVMFGLPVFSWSQHVRAGVPQVLSESVATFGLLSVIWGGVRRRPEAVPFAVGAYITAAYWFTSSTSFANPAVTIARACTDTFAGIRPLDVPGFLIGQVAGAAAATALFRWLVPTLPRVADRVVVPHEQSRHEAITR